MNINDIDFIQLSEVIGKLEKYDYNDICVIIFKHCPGHSVSEIIEALVDLNIIDSEKVKPILMGYKGSVDFDTGVVYAPYPIEWRNQMPISDSVIKE